MAHNLRIGSLLEGKVWWPDLEVADHITSNEEPQVMVSAHDSFSLFLQSRTSAHGMMFPIDKMSLPTSVTLSQIISHRHAQTHVS